MDRFAGSLGKELKHHLLPRPQFESQHYARVVNGDNLHTGGDDCGELFAFHVFFPQIPLRLGVFCCIEHGMQSIQR